MIRIKLVTGLFAIRYGTVELLNSLRHGCWGQRISGKDVWTNSWELGFAQDGRFGRRKPLNWNWITVIVERNKCSLLYSAAVIRPVKQMRTLSWSTRVEQRRETPLWILFECYCGTSLLWDLERCSGSWWFAWRWLSYHRSSFSVEGFDCRWSVFLSDVRDKSSELRWLITVTLYLLIDLTAFSQLLFQV